MLRVCRAATEKVALSLRGNGINGSHIWSVELLKDGADRGCSHFAFFGDQRCRSCIKNRITSNPHAFSTISPYLASKIGSVRSDEGKNRREIMKKQNKILIGILTGAVILSSIIATSVLAAPKSIVSTVTGGIPAVPVTATGVATPAQADYEEWGCPMLNGDYAGVATLLGITTEEIQAQLQQGKSLVEIGAAKGVSEDKLVAAILDPMKQFMQQQVTAGVWTQAQLDARLTLAEQHIRQIVNVKGGFNYAGGCGGTGGMMSGSGSYGGTSYGRGGMMGGRGQSY